MKKAFTIAALLVLIAASFGYTALKLGFLGDSGNWANRNLRGAFIKSVFLRGLFGLHLDGDGRYDYLGTAYQRIVIEVDAVSGKMPDPAALDLFKQRVAEATGKPVILMVSDTDIPDPGSLTAEKISQLAGSYRSVESEGASAAVYLLALTEDPADAQLLGQTYQDSGIVLFEDALRGFVSSAPSTLPLYEESTALHEFGHQLGLPHNEEEGCLMGAHAEQNHHAANDPSLVVTDFCGQEKDQIKSIKNSY